MDPIPPAAPQPAAPAPRPASSDTAAKIVYVLYLLSLVTGGLTHLVGVVIAYVNVGGAPEPSRSHYRFQIRTFWIGLLYGVVVLFLAVVWIGFIALAFLAVWLVVRCVKGLMVLDRRQPYPDVETWLW
ncbi:MAG TPA: hypothetical protein VIV57_15995 [Anaeromyxobacter sp.]